MRLEASDPLSTILFQVTGPAHIPWQDPRWQELLHGYNIWVHVEAYGVVDQASKSLVDHAPQSSNLAAFALHIIRMLEELDSSPVDDFSSRIALVGKARAISGALNLFRILSHALIVEAVADDDGDAYLAECFWYRSRDSSREQDAGRDLLDGLLSFLTSDPTVSNVPEVYDATVYAAELLLVLLSAQLYQPMISSFQRVESHLPLSFFWGLFMSLSIDHQSKWTPRSLLAVWINWVIERPPALDRSIAEHNASLVKSVVAAKGERLGEDGMYENYAIVQACAPTSGVEAETAEESTVTSTSQTTVARHRSNLLFDATRGVLVLSSNIILLPFRLMSLALGLWGHKEKEYDQAHRKNIQSHLHAHLTKDALWLSDSPLADLASCLLLLVTNNERAAENPFRQELASFADNRWDAGDHALPDLPRILTNGMVNDDGDERIQLIDLPSSARPDRPDVLAVNFEELFKAFGRAAHNELGALLLYTMMQSSQVFAESIAVRSDLDTFVLPLLRTLYFSSSLRHYSAQDYSTRVQANRRPSNDSVMADTAPLNAAVSIRNCPFRSQSQLYVIIILLLLFSQDPSFGPDAFRRVIVPRVPWYKERHMKDVSLGSVLLLCLLRSLTFNLNRIRDAFLLNNCCAVLMNLSPAVSDLHEYAAMRLVSITVSSMKRYRALRSDKPDMNEEEDPSDPSSMHGEASRTLLRLLKQCLSAKAVERNLNLVYALVYHQVELKTLATGKGSPFKKSEVDRVLKVIESASQIIEEDGDARTASKALKILGDHMNRIRSSVSDRRKRSEADCFMFNYEEEADPEIFFVPYTWEVITCCATSSTIEWKKNHIQVFPLLDDKIWDDITVSAEPTAATTQIYSKDVSDVV